MSVRRLVIAAGLSALCMLAQAQELLAGKPNSWPEPATEWGNTCHDVSGTYRANPVDKKTQEPSASESLAIMVFLYTPGRLNVPPWIWDEASEVKISYAQGKGMSVIARDQHRSREVTREITSNALECRDGIILLTWSHGGHTEGVSHNTVSYLGLYRTDSGELVVSDNLIDRATTLFVFSSTTERHDWYLYPAVVEQ